MIAMLEYLRAFLGNQDWKKATSVPGWRGRPSFMKKDRTPFQGRGKKYGTQHMKVEKFYNKDERDERFRQLRGPNNVRHVSKFSDVVGRRDVWCIVRP
jgi:hypothetical protein